MTESGRMLTDIARKAEPEASAVLSQMEDKQTPPDAYRQAMRAAGKILAEQFAMGQDVAKRTFLLAMTAEDADFLGGGVIDAFERAGADVRIACLWNNRIKPFGVQWLDIATIVEEYRDPLPEKIDYLVVLKSIISGACVVKTNLAHILNDVTPEQVHVMAPVMLKGAEHRLGKEFPPEIAARFQYWTLAVDDAKDSDGNVAPGIGGDVYARLGLGDVRKKNAVLPKVVAERMETRNRFAAV
jgi:hypothetical protein